MRIVQGSSSVPVAGTADDEGFITVVAKKTPDKVRIEWTTPDRSNEQIFPFAHEVFVAPPDDATDEGAEGALQRLHNVGYVHQVGLREKVLAFAAELLEASADDLELADSVVSVRGTPARSVTLGEIAGAAYLAGAPQTTEAPVLEVATRYSPSTELPLASDRTCSAS